MFTPLKKTALHDLLNKPILFDANIFMVGIAERTSDKNCSFENMKQLYIKPLFESFTDIYIHEEVYKELDEKSREFVESYKGKNVTVVSEKIYMEAILSIQLFLIIYLNMNWSTMREGALKIEERSIVWYMPHISISIISVQKKLWLIM